MKAIELDKEKLIDLYVGQGKTQKECAILLEVSDSVIKRHLGKLGIKIRPASAAIRHDISDDQVIELYWDQGLSMAVTARTLGMSEGFVRKRLRSSGHGTRTVSEGARKWRKTEHITNEELIRLHDILGWSCTKISEHFGMSKEFTRQRFMVIGKERRGPYGNGNGAWKGGTTPIREIIRTSIQYQEWRTKCFERSSFKSDLSNIGSNDLIVHHLVPFKDILESVFTKHTILPDDIKNMAILNDSRFYDLGNGIVVNQNEHKLIEQNNVCGHPWWRIWKIFPKFAILKSGLTCDQFEIFNDRGTLDPHGCTIRPIDRKVAIGLIRYWHYLGTIPPSVLILGCYADNILVGVATFGFGINKNISPFTWELTRLCVPGYILQPFSCRLIDLCCQYIKKNHKHIKQLISFADPSIGHNGGLYRMAGWEKDGHTQPSYSYFDPNTNRLRHKSFCRRTKELSEKELAQKRNLIKIPLPPKYKYRLIL